MSSERFAIGVDLGGQSVKLAVVDAQGAMDLKRQVSIRPSLSAAEVTELLVEQIQQLAAEVKAAGHRPAGAGVVMPGYMDRERTRLEMAANLPSLSGSTLLADVRRAAGMPVVFDADCNAAAVAEYHHGAGRGVSRLIVVTVGTGIGGGVMIDGRVLRVRNHIAGSLGHVTVDARGPRCPCGGRGCVEALAAGPVLERRAEVVARHAPDSMLGVLKRERGRLTGVELGAALAAGDPGAADVVHEGGWWLGAGVASWAAIFSPHKVIVGGGLSSLGEPYLRAIRQGMFDVAQPQPAGREIAIEAAALGPDAGIIGAATMVLLGEDAY